MNKVHESLLRIISKGVKQDTFDDEPAQATGSPAIKRLQSLACVDTPGQSEMAEASNSNGAAGDRALPSVAFPTPADTEYHPAETAAEPASPDEMQWDALPAEESHAPDNAVPIQTPGPIATILVVEDDIVTQRLMKKILEDRGYEVVLAEDGVDALMALGKISFDLILCDINMPNMDGFKLVEYLNQKNIVIPVIFITVREDVEDEIRGLALGAKDYIRKPVNKDLLLLRIRKALDK